MPEVRRSTATMPVMTAPPIIKGAQADKPDNRAAALKVEAMTF
jgi:hypothetical protein